MKSGAGQGTETGADKVWRTIRECHGGSRKVLTAAAVRTAKGPAKLYDGNGLFLRVEASRRPGGGCSGIVIRGKPRELGLGSAELVTLAEARETALANRKAARAGGDPLAARRAADAVMTFAEAARAVHEAHLPTWRNPKHAAQFIATLGELRLPAFRQDEGVRCQHGRRARGAGADLDREAGDGAAGEAAHRRGDGVGHRQGVAQGQPGRRSSARRCRRPARRSRQHRKALPYGEVAGCLAAVRASRAALADQAGPRVHGADRGRSGEVRLAHRREFDLDAGRLDHPRRRG